MATVDYRDLNVGKNNLSASDRRKYAKQQMEYPENKFEAVDLSIAKFIPKNMTRAFRNNRYTVMVYDDTPTTHGDAIKILIQNHFDEPFKFHWRTLQRIKNELFGIETVAIEYYPSEKELINDHNIYWLWIYPKDILPLPIFR